MPSHLDLAAQKSFIEQHERLRNGLGADEAIVYGDAVHPTHQTRPAGVWMPRGADVAVPAASGRDRMKIHGVIDLETGATRMKEVLSVDAQSTIELLTSSENAYATMRRIHVYLDNARYHHARLVQDWMRQPGRRIVLHFIPSCCPHLNPIERLWGVMHQNVTHNQYYATFKEFAEAILLFLKETVPKHFSRFSSRITDNSASETQRIFGSSRRRCIEGGSCCHSDESVVRTPLRFREFELRHGEVRGSFRRHRSNPSRLNSPMTEVGSR